ncbi:hypothetical protein [Mesorhizobium sp. M0174]|uniref:hypothetical protein n=1 Tax=unclassified Mesorhizobium TaxID=325217 RepID=UPI003338B0F4
MPGVTWNDEMQKKFKEDELADSGAMLLGRYEIFVGSWPPRNRRLCRPVQRAAEICRLDELGAAPPAIDTIELAATRRKVLIRPFLLLR